MPFVCILRVVIDLVLIGNIERIGLYKRPVVGALVSSRLRAGPQGVEEAKTHYRALDNLIWAACILLAIGEIVVSKIETQTKLVTCKNEQTWILGPTHFVTISCPM